MSDKALELCSQLGIQVDPQLWELAHIHRSYAYENGGIPTNERIEFLGDSVLGIVVTEYLYLTFPQLPEGQLARLRASVVNTHALARVARTLDVGEHIMLGHGEVATNGKDKDSILADTMESMIGAIFLSGGHEAAGKFVHHLFDPLVDESMSMGAGLDWKTSLQEVAAANSWAMPTYDIEQFGPDHDRTYTAFAVLAGRRFEPGQGKNKKQAEQLAAANAFKQLKAEGVVAADA